MEFVTCCVCGNRVQQSNGIDICGLCIKTKGDRVKILAIKKYLEKHPNASALELVETLEIKPREIDKFIKEGGLRAYKSVDGSKMLKVPEKNKKVLTKEEQRKETLSRLANVYNNKPQINLEPRRHEPTEKESKLVADLRQLYTNKSERDRER